MFSQDQLKEISKVANQILERKRAPGTYYPVTEIETDAILEAYFDVRYEIAGQEKTTRQHTREAG
jgi:hypothetical protein